MPSTAESSGPAGADPPPDLPPGLRSFAPAMRAALIAARNALATDDVPVGAVVLDLAGTVIGTGWNAREATADPTAHAEVLALRAAAAATGSWRLAGATVVVTLEPCVMCAGAIVAARVDRVVFGAYDDRAGAAGSVWDLLRDRALLHRPEVAGGLLAADCAVLLADFFAGRR